MNRHNDFLTKIISQVAIVIFTLVPAVESFADPIPRSIIYPTGVFPTDVQNVQAAVNQGGVVLLKAINSAGQLTAFNFGSPEYLPGRRVLMTIDVDIVGEKIGENMTTIHGGFSPFRSSLPVKSRIMGINFEGPLLEAISIRASTGSEIIGNKVSGVVPVTYFFSGFSFTETEGIFVYPVRGDASKIVGKLRIADNDIAANGSADFAFGIQVDAVSADVEISGNTVSFPQNNGFLDHTGIGVFRGHSSVSILSNDISMASGSLETYPVPIMVAGDLDARYVIAKNHVINMHPNGDGIEVRGGDFSEPTQGTLVFDNRVFMNSSADVQGSGVSLIGAVNNTLVVHNQIEGTSAFALEVSDGANITSSADSNIFVGNNISKLFASVADVYFSSSSSNALFTGQCQTVIDLGLGNRIVCGKQNNMRDLRDHGKSVRAKKSELLRKNILDQRSDLP